jgi:hypothetical protein
MASDALQAVASYIQYCVRLMRLRVYQLLGCIFLRRTINRFWSIINLDDIHGGGKTVYKAFNTLQGQRRNLVDSWGNLLAQFEDT